MDVKKPLNCWEFKKCGREIGGPRTGELGVCPAAKDRSLDGIHRGDNGGRACWIIAGTYCGGKIQGTHAAKIDNCSQCEFFKLVQEEEQIDLIEEVSLLKVQEIVTRN